MAPDTKHDTFADVAVELGYLTPVQLGHARDRARADGAATKPLADVLVELKLLTAEQIAHIRQEQQRRGVSGERRVGPFEIIEKIGAGGMGAV
jgi:hypothetical protein